MKEFKSERRRITRRTPVLISSQGFKTTTSPFKRGHCYAQF